MGSNLPQELITSIFAFYGIFSNGNSLIVLIILSTLGSNTTQLNKMFYFFNTLFHTINKRLKNYLNKNLTAQQSAAFHFTCEPFSFAHEIKCIFCLFLLLLFSLVVSLISPESTETDCKENKNKQ